MAIESVVCGKHETPSGGVIEKYLFSSINLKSYSRFPKYSNIFPPLHCIKIRSSLASSHKMVFKKSKCGI